MVVFGGAGGRSNEGRLQVDGLSVGTAFNGAGVSAYVADVNNAQEVVLTASGGMGESETGGPVLNLVPKEGGNRLSGQLYASVVTEGMTSSNYTDELRARGPDDARRLHQRVRLQRRCRRPDHEGSHLVVPAGAQRGLRAEDPRHVRQRRSGDLVLRPRPDASGLRRGEVPDVGAAPHGAVEREEQDHGILGRADAVRRRRPYRRFGGLPTFQAKDQIICAGASPTPSCSPTSAPETGAYRDVGQRIQQARWTSPQTNRLLLEAGFGTYMSRWGGEPMPGADPNSDPRDRPVHHGRRRCRRALRARDCEPELPRARAGAVGGCSWPTIAGRRRTSSAGTR